MEVEVTTIAARAGTIRAQMTPEVVAKIADALAQTTPTDRKAVAIGGEQPKEGTARTIVEAAMRALAELDPPVHVRTHIAIVAKDDKGNATGYRGSVSLTPDGKPSRKLRGEQKNGATPAETPATPTTPAKR